MASEVNFQIVPLRRDEFESLFPMPDPELHARGIRRVTADSKPGFPCRVSLEDAEIGETLLLLPYAHHRTDSPYRASGPIYVRQSAATAAPAVNVVPEYVSRRLVSVRAYDTADMMVEADVTEGTKLAGCVRRLFAYERVAYLHVHNAKAGCYSCRIDRA